jgi:multiple sugar transport system permease protein
VVTVLFPLVWMAGGAFKTYSEVLDMPPKLLPSEWNLDNFFQLRQYFDVERFLFNSILVSLATLVLQILISVMAGFVFAKIAFKGRQLLFILYMATMMIPFQIYMTTLFRIFVGLHLKDNLIAVILPGTFSVFSIFLMRQHIMTIPDSYIEAGLLDGASYFRILFSIIIPLCKPAMATIAVFAFMNSWNQFIWPLIIIDSKENMTLPLGLSRVQGRFRTEYNLLMTGNLFMFIPMFLTYLFAQKFFIRSISLSGIKG